MPQPTKWRQAGEDISDEEAIEAARQAQILDTLTQLPEGLDSFIGAGGGGRGFSPHGREVPRSWILTLEGGCEGYKGEGQQGNPKSLSRFSRVLQHKIRHI